jgi:tetratricopeptide (TPR) repeat protein
MSSLSWPLRGALAASMLVGLCTVALGGGIDLIRAGEAAQRAGNMNAALTAYAAAIQSSDLTASQRAYAFAKRGGVRGYLGEAVRGIDDYSRAIELDSLLANAHSLRGYLRGVIGQYDLAEKDQLAAIALSRSQQSNDLVAWELQHYADIWRRRGDYDQALAYCDKAEQLKPRADATFRRAWIYLDMGRLEQARAEYQKFVVLEAAESSAGGQYWPDERGAIGRLQELR